MRLTLYLPLLLLCALSIAACTSGQKAREADGRDREFWVSFKIREVNDTLGVPHVQCPDDVDVDEGAHYRCVAKAGDGTSVAVNVVQPRRFATGLRVSTKLLETRKVEMRLRHDLNVGRLSEPGVVLLDCQDLVEVKKGGHFTCQGKALFRDLTVRATFTNDRGKFTYTVRSRPSRRGN